MFSFLRPDLKKTRIWIRLKPTDKNPKSETNPKFNTD
jgi:hypothetical protein